MALNIAPHIPNVIVNAAAPATESLAHSNAIKEVVPAPTQVEAAVPQKSREQDARPPVLENPTYDDIQRQFEPEVIPEQEDGDEQTSQEQASQDDAEGDTDESTVIAGGSDENDPAEEQEQEQKEAKERAEQQTQEQIEQAELQQIRQLERRDAEVRAHEQAHASVGGQYAGSPSYDYETGPNGKKYAVGGEVPIDVSPEADPEQTIRKMQTVRAAALAPAEPSSQDRKVAAEASQKLSEARADLISETAEAEEASRPEPKVEGSADEGSVEQSTSTENGVEQVNSDSPLVSEQNQQSLTAQSVNDDNTETVGSNLSDTENPISRVIDARYQNSFQQTTNNSQFQAVA